MATLTIDGQNVTVDDGFLKLSPDQQNATVEEIAASLPKRTAAPSASSDTFSSFDPPPMAQPSQWEAFKAGLSAIADDPRRLFQVGPLKLIPAAADAVTLPRDVIQGKVDPLSDEGIGRATDFALLANPAPPRGLMPTAPAVAASAPAAPASLFANDALSQAARLNIELPRFAASESPAIQAVGQASRQLPLAGGIVEKAATKLTGDLATKAGEIGASLTERTGLDKAALGNQLRDALEGAVGNITEANHSSYAGVRGIVDANKPVKAALEPIQNVLSDVMARRLEAGESGLGQLQPVANLLQRPGGVSFAGLQRARSRISKAIDFDARMGGGMEQGDLKQVYGALTDAMEGAVRGAAKGDPEAAVTAWRTADQNFAESMGNMRSLSQALRSSSDEAIVNQVVGMAGERSGNAKRLVQLSRDIGPENMRMLGAHVLDQAGGAEWSPARFSTAIGKLSDTAKNVLFGPARQQVEDLHALATRWSTQEAKYANRSNTGRAALLGGYGAGVVGAAMSNPLLAVGKVLAGAAGGYTLGQALSSPVTAKVVVQTARAAERVARDPSPAAQNAFNALRRQLINLTVQSRGEPRRQPQFQLAPDQL
jgi:hypothetical protein